MTTDDNFLNVYGPRGPHEIVQIIGTADALKALIKDIEAAINAGESESNPYDSTGEQFRFVVQRVRADEAYSLINPYRW